MKEATQGPAARAFRRHWNAREPFLQRARRISRLTVTSLFREQGENETTSETVPWQSFGAYAVNTLSSKAVLGIFPPGIPYISLEATKSTLDDLDANVPDEQRGVLKANIEKGLAAVETEFAEGCEEDGDRMVAFDAARHLIVGGNHCIKLLKDASLQGIPLEQYTCVRDASGNLVEGCIEEPMVWDTLPEDVQALAISQGYELDYEEGGNGPPKASQAPVCVYTHIRRIKGGQYKVYQECWGEMVPGTEYTYDADSLPYIFLRMVALKKESYGRSFCEDYEGDLQTLDGLVQIVVEGSAAVAQLKWLVKPGGVTNKKQFTELPNGGVMTGDPEDVGAVKSEHQTELQIAAQQGEKVESRLARVFLLYSSIQRQGERVTAEEIATMRQDLDAGLGGVYSNLAVSWQRPQARLKMAALQRLGRMTKLPKGTTKMKLLTGDAALGRDITMRATDTVLQKAAALFPQAFASYVNLGVYLSRATAAEHVDPDGLVKTDEQIATDQANAQRAQMAQAVAPEVVKGVSGVVQQSQQAALDGGVQPPAPAAPQPAGA